MVIRMVFEIKKTAMKINKATPIKPQFRMKVPRANKRWVSTPPSLTSETPSIFWHQPKLALHIWSCCLYIISIIERDWHLHQKSSSFPSRFDQFIILLFLARKINLVDMLHGCQSIVDLMVVFIGHGLTVFSICSLWSWISLRMYTTTRTLFWISSES